MSANLLFDNNRISKKSHLIVDNLDNSLSFEEVIDKLGIADWEPMLVPCNDGGTNGEWFRVRRSDNGVILHPSRALSNKSKLLSNRRIIEGLENTLRNDPLLYIREAALLSGGEQLMIQLGYHDNVALESKVLGKIFPNTWLKFPVGFAAYRKIDLPVMLRCTNQVPALKAQGFVKDTRITHLQAEEKSDTLFDVDRTKSIANILKQINFLEKLNECKWRENIDYSNYLEILFNKPIEKLPEKTANLLDEIYWSHPGCVELEHSVLRGFSAATRYHNQRRYQNNIVKYAAQIPGTLQFNFLTKAATVAEEYAASLNNISL